MEERKIVALLVLLYLLWRRHCRNKRRPRRFWVRGVFQRRIQHGEYHNLLQEMRLNDSELHFRYLRMSRTTFDELLLKVRPFLYRRKYRSALRPEISPAERLAITLRYLATGNSQVSLSFNFRVGRSTLCRIVRETCSVIWQVLCKDFVRAPSTEDEWIGISEQFARLWNFPVLELLMESMWLFKLLLIVAQLSTTTKEHTQLFFWRSVMHTIASLLWTSEMPGVTVMVVSFQTHHLAKPSSQKAWQFHHQEHCQEPEQWFHLYLLEMKLFLCVPT